MAQITIPGGEYKGKPPSELPDDQVLWWAEHCNKEDVAAACREEAKRRGLDVGREEAPPPDEPKQRQKAKPAAAAPRQSTAALTVGASIASGGNLMATLSSLADKAILVAPTMAVEHLPEGAEVAISMVRADTKSQDCYQVTGDRQRPGPSDTMGLGGPLLQRIAGAAGITWIRDATIRTDDGKNPYRVGYRTWCRVQDVDGSFRDYPGECEVDLSDGGPQAIDIIDKARKRERDPEKQLAEARKFIQRSTLTKAMNSAIRKACGLRHAYTRAELETKPFAVAKLLFTGRTDDPDLKPLFAQIMAQKFGLAAHLLGPAPAPQRKPQVFTTDAEPVPEPFDDGEY